MSKIYFFTNDSSISNAQVAENAFGQLPDIGTTERYNLENKFSVSIDSPAIAITKSLVLAMPTSNSQILNIALLPLNSFSSGFPVKIFIYRGINRDSLIDGNSNIKTEDNSWSPDNILRVIKENQDKINTQNGTNLNANSNSLGLQFSTLPNETYIEKLFFDDTDEFHPIIVDAGCQIGKFVGGTDLAGVEVILDLIGYEPKLELLKTSNHIFVIQKLVLSNALTEKEKLIQRFNNRFRKEEVLAYLDITAFYGATKNQGFKIKGSDNNDGFLENFYNRNTVYIDIRDDRGFSYNHFFKLSDNLDIGFYESSDSGATPVYYTLNYYLNWPILKLTNTVYSNNKKCFYITIPILVGSPENFNFISSFTSTISTEKGISRKRHSILSVVQNDSTVHLNKTEPIKLKNWCFNNENLGANYFLLKKSSIGNTIIPNPISNLFNNFFSLKMTNIFNSPLMENGEFSVYNYSVLNSPLIIDVKKSEAFYPCIGIAFDKEYVSFFSYKDESVYLETNTKSLRAVALIRSGKYKRAVSSSDLQYDPLIPNQSVGFLNQLVKNDTTNNVILSKIQLNNIEDPSDANNLIQLITYKRNGKSDIYNEAMETFQAISFTREEYNFLKSEEQNNAFTDIDFFINHPMYINAITVETKDYGTFQIQKQNISLGVASITDVTVTTDSNIDLIDYPEELVLSSEPIQILSVNFKN